MNTELVKSISIESLLGHRQTISDRLEAAHRALSEAEQVLDTVKETLAKNSTVGISIADMFNSYNSNYRANFMHDGGVERALRNVDRELWSTLLEESGLKTFLDAKARKEWAQNLERGDFPPLTAETIKATFASMYSQRGDFFERGVVECFKLLSWDYKSNSPVSFGRRIVIDYIMSPYGQGWRTLNHDSCDKIDDLIRVFCLMDGKPEPDHRDGIYFQLAKAKAEQETGELELDYFRIKWFKKGTAHLYFTQPDLVDEMNKILAKHHPNALPPRKGDANPKATKEKAKESHRNAKADFFPTPKAVIDTLLNGIVFKNLDLVLEPSAGGGAIANAVRVRGGTLHLIEKDLGRVSELEKQGYRPTRADFLDIEATGGYEYVAMNPPFSGGQDIDHVMHAYDFLKPGGTLLAVVGRGAVTLGNKKCKSFQSFLEERDADIQHLPEGSFKESGTMVNASIVRIQKPLSIAG